MPRLLADISGPFYSTKKPFRNWSSFPFAQIDLPQPPYVDSAQLAWGLDRALSYLACLHEQGYTGIVIDDLAHLTTFDQAAQMLASTRDACHIRAQAYRATFQTLFAQAAAYGMEVFVTTDMQWATPALQQYVGDLRPQNPRLVAANQWALEALFRHFPQVSGLVVRVGETGGAHNLGAEYTGHLIYRSVSSLRQLIATLLPICEQYERLLVLRSWSIGIGELGDLMWSPERYQAVFADYDSAHLLVSIKHGPSDFFRHLPANPTLGLPGPAQIIELQNRREYELFGMVPAAAVQTHRQIAQTVSQHTPITGIWAWNSTGGWGGGCAALGSTGWSLWTELTSAVTAALILNPTLVAEDFVARWCIQRFGSQHQEFALCVARLYCESEQIFSQAWYFGNLAQPKQLGGLFLPPLLWVWWMRPTAAPLIWAYLAAAIGDDYDCVAAGATALAKLDSLYAQLSQCYPGDLADADFVIKSTAYLRDCLMVAHSMRAMFLPLAQAAARADRASWIRLTGQALEMLQVLQEHTQSWGRSEDFPALELDEVCAYLKELCCHSERSWYTARAASLLVRQVGRTKRLSGFRKHGRISLAMIGLVLWRRPGLRAMLLGSLLTWQLGQRSRQLFVRRALPHLSRRLFLLPSIFFETGPAMDEWAG